MLRNLAGEIGEEWEARAGRGEPADDLLALVKQIVPYHMGHNAETDAVDLLLEVSGGGFCALVLPPSCISPECALPALMKCSSPQSGCLAHPSDPCCSEGNSLLITAGPSYLHCSARSPSRMSVALLMMCAPQQTRRLSGRTQPHVAPQSHTRHPQCVLA